MTRTAAALLLAITGPVPAVHAEMLIDPNQIFARARAFWLEQHYPPLLEYTVAVSVLEGGTVKTQRYWSAYDSASRLVAVDPISDYEKAHPTYAAGGLNVNIPLLSRLSKPQPLADYLGVPVLAPNYSFGMADIPATHPQGTPDPSKLVDDVRAEFHDPNPRRASPGPTMPSSLPIIEKETIYNQTYRVTLVGTETIEGVPAYHLHLQALREPGRYRLQELWVDTRNFAPIELIERLNFVEVPARAYRGASGSRFSTAHSMSTTSGRCGRCATTA